MLEVIPGVYQLPNSFVNLYLIAEADGLTLIDTGIHRSGPKVVLEALGKLGRQAQELKTILITHADGDHTGGASMLKQATGASICSSQAAANAMAAGQAEREAKGGPVFKFVNKAIMPLFMPAAPPQNVDRILMPGETLPILGGLQVIATPGHTPEHLSFFAPAHRLLFAGDSMQALGGKLSFGDGPFTWNLETGIQSVRHQAKLGPDVVCCGHGPVVRGSQVKFPHLN